MAFTAYIFQEDYDRLTTKEVSHAAYSQQQKGGSLFGQWTSTGNPVIHRVMPFSSPSQGTASRDAVARDLYEGFRVCYIGEWRPVPHHNYNYMHTREAREEREARERLQGREGPARFLVLDVSKTDIVPFLLNRQTARQESGKLEKLSGKNPFNKRESFEEPMPRRDYDYAGVRHPTGRPNVPYKAPGAARFQEATTTEGQWYSGKEGIEKLQKVVEDLKRIAEGNVDMSRDTKTQDISLTFKDKHRGNNWEIRFPSMFPTLGALLILNPGTPQERHQKQAYSDKASKAVKNMISTIQTMTFI